MKPIVALVLFLLAGRLISTLTADPLSDVAALNAQRDSEERYKRLAADVQSVLETQEVLIKRQDEFRQRLDKLVDELRTLKEDHTRAAGSVASRDELRKYVEKLRELDEKRESDKKVILENIKDLAKAPPPVSAEPKAGARHSASESNDEPPYVYVIKKNDQLLTIIGEYNDYFQKHGQSKITVAQVLKANPGLKADRLVAGSKVRIPVPPKESK